MSEHSPDPGVQDQSVQAEPVEVEQEQQEVVEQKQELQEDRTQKLVPLQALDEARHKTRELRAEMQRLREEQAHRDAVLNQRLEALQRRDQPPPPDPEQDPFGSLRHEIADLSQKFNRTAEQQQASEATRQQTEFVQRVTFATAQQEAAFTQKTPDYFDATKYLHELRAQELQTLGVPEDQIPNAIKAEAFQMCVGAMRDGVSVAERAYQIAKVRGYKPKQNVQEKFEAKQRGIEASKSLGSGGAAQEKVTLEQLANMPEEEFKKLTAGDNWEKLHSVK